MMLPMAGAALAGVASLAVPAPPPQAPQNIIAPTIRKYFPETWLWNCNLSGLVEQLFFVE